MEYFSCPLTIENMTWDEKLRAMEELWKSLSREEARLESPPGHEEALRETAARHDAGKEQSRLGSRETRTAQAR
jgi:hypothetical protein